MSSSRPAKLAKLLLTKMVLDYARVEAVRLLAATTAPAGADGPRAAADAVCEELSRGISIVQAAIEKEEPEPDLAVPTASPDVALASNLRRGFELLTGPRGRPKRSSVARPREQKG